VFLVRRAKVEDIPSLLKLAKMVHFINLPPDHEIISEKVAWSRNCFMMAADEEVGTAPRKPAPAQARDPHEHGALAAGIRNIVGQSPLFMFVLEEIETQGVIGTSQIISRFGGPGQPNVSLQLERKELFSHSLQMGVTHTVARIHLDETGPTEIGGLILQPSFRGHRDKLGRLIALVRFHFMGLHRHHFSDRVLAEMMGPITIDGYNPFWEHCTRAFINLTYEQADKFCQQSKEFILTLFPRTDLYLTLISPEARSVVGTVGPETIPARRMLEKIGFKYHNRVDPFDGGPHLEAQLDDIELVKKTSRLRLANPADTAHTHSGLVSTLDEDGEFRCVQTTFAYDRQGRIILSRKMLELIQGEPGAEAGVTVLSALKPAEPAPSKTKKPAPKKKPAKR
jgi:arginine N-succinyltransferase